MNVHTIEVPPDLARLKLDEYKALRENQRTTEDRLLERAYKAVAGGARVIDISQAFRSTGLNEFGQPRLAIARADEKFCRFRSDAEYQSNRILPSGYRPGFTINETWNSYASRSNILLPVGVFPGPQKITGQFLRTQVPHIPPSARPVYKLENYHVLFEVKKWEAYSVDPYLLKRISSGYLFIVEAEWELTELEASLLGSMSEQ
jgi:hypothetical protein